MTAWGMMALHFRIADFKFTHTFIICHRLPDTEILLGIDPEKNSLSYVWDKEKSCYMQTMVYVSLTLETLDRNNRNHQINFKIPPRLNVIIPIKIKGHTIKGHMAYFINDQDSTKGKDPNIKIINSIPQHQRKNNCEYSCIKLHQQTYHF